MGITKADMLPGTLVRCVLSSGAELFGVFLCEHTDEKYRYSDGTISLGKFVWARAQDAAIEVGKFFIDKPHLHPHMGFWNNHSLQLRQCSVIGVLDMPENLVWE